MTVLRKGKKMKEREFIQELQRLINSIVTAFTVRLDDNSKETNKQKQDNEDSVIGNVSSPATATLQDHHEAYLAWWHTRWGILDIL